MSETTMQRAERLADEQEDRALSVTPTVDFQQRMFARIREQIGDLMTDEDLKKIVESAVEKAFFEPVIIRKTYGPDETKPAPMVAMIRDLLVERVDNVMKEYIAANGDRIDAMLKEQLGKGFHGMIEEYWNSKLSNALNQFQTQLYSLGLLK